MRLSTVVELLLILLLVAFAAYGRVIDRDELLQDHHRTARAADKPKQMNAGVSTLSLKQAAENVNRYCTCNEMICNCCRDFHIPLVQLKGPGCASLQYLKGDNLAVQLSFGENILTSTIVNGKSPKPVCVPLPGGYTKFCGRIYSIQRDDNQHFKACLGLEVQSSTELEAGLRVSCFRFGPEGLKLRPAEPLPPVAVETSDDDDDDDDLFGLDDDDDDDDEDDEEDRPIGNAVPTSAVNSEAEDDDDDDDDDDVLGLGALLDIITGDDESSSDTKQKTTTAPPLLNFTIPILSRPTTSAPIENHEPSNLANNVPHEDSNEVAQFDNVTEDSDKLDELTTESAEEEEAEAAVTNIPEEVQVSNDKVLAQGSANEPVYALKPVRPTHNTKVKKGSSAATNKKKPVLVSPSINAIEVDDGKDKPVGKPVEHNQENDDDDDDDDEDDILGTSDLEDDDDDEGILGGGEDDDDSEDDDDDDDEDEKEEDDKHEEDEDEKAEDLEELADDDDDDDDDEEEEDVVISALVEDDVDGEKKTKKVAANATTAAHDVDDDDSDYGIGFSGLLARKRHTGRQSKVMRL